MPETILRTFAPITPGKLRGLETVAGAIQAERDLRQIANLSTVLGGEHARDYAATLERAAQHLDRERAKRDPVAKARRAAAKRAEVAAFAGKFFGQKIEPCPPAS